MTDAFALLGLERRPWLDPDDVKRRFHERSAPWHPDRHHGADEDKKAEAQRIYSDLNAAHQLLVEPKERLLHLIELERGERPKDIQRIPPGTMDLFMEVGQACRDCDEFLQRRGTSTSPMLRLKSLQEGLEWDGRIEDIMGRVRSREFALLEELRGMDAAWHADSGQGRPGCMERLEPLYRAFSYVARWLAQLHERRALLAAG